MNQTANAQQSSTDSRARMGLGTAIGMAMGLLIGLLLDSIGLGFAIGVGLGVALGLAFSQQRRERSKPLTIAGIVLLAVGVALLAVILSLVRPHWWCEYPVLSLLPGC